MKYFALLRLMVLFLLGGTVLNGAVQAQQLPGTTNGIAFSVSTSATNIAVGSEVFYTITLTNTAYFDDIVEITNFLPSTVVVQSATNPYGGYTNYSTNVFVFSLTEVSQPYVTQLILGIVPTNSGLISNTIVIGVPGLTTNLATTNIVINATNTIIEADLGVTYTGPSQPIITNDWVTYTMTVSNAGPDAAPGVFLANVIATNGFDLIGYNPTNTPQFVITNGYTNLVFNLGTLPANAFTNIQVTVQLTTNGYLPLGAEVIAPGVTNFNTNNVIIYTNLFVTNYGPGQITVGTNSAQNLNLQNALLEQSVLLSNVGSTGVAAERIVVTGLTNKFLFNAVGTNNGNPFVTIAAPLPVGASGAALLQYAPRGSFPLASSQLQAYDVPFPNLTPPVVTSTSTNININGIYRLANGNMLIQFPAKTNHTYTIVYSDNSRFSNACVAMPSFTAQANVAQWIDYGPPATISTPTNSNLRFYRVLQNQ